MTRVNWMVLGLASVALLLYMVRPFIDVVVYGLFVYYILRPLYFRINKRVSSRKLSAAASILILLAPIILLSYYAFSVTSTKLKSVIASMDDPLGDRLHHLLKDISDAMTGFNMRDITNLIQKNQDLGRLLIYLSKSTFGLIFKFILVFAIAFYLLKDGSDVRAWFMSTIYAEKDRKLAKSLFDGIDADLYQIFLGNILAAFVTAVLGVLVYSGIDIFSPSKAIDVPYPVLLGVLSGIANLIPVVGMKLIWIPLASYMWGNAYLTGILIENTSFLIFATLAIYFIVDSFPDTILRPYLAGREHIPMGLLFFTYIFGTAVFGLAGIILGPIILVVTVNFFRLVLPEIKKDQ